jgi:hypothetical protein
MNTLDTVIEHNQQVSHAVLLSLAIAALLITLIILPYALRRKRRETDKAL